MQHLSILTAGLSYIPAGLTFGYLLLLPLDRHERIQDIYNETMFWPYIVAMMMLIISVALTNGLKLNYRKCQFVHLYVQLAAMIFYVAAGLIFLLTSERVPAIYLSACGMGLTLTPGLSYIHIRAPGRFRSIYMGFCYFCFLVGLAGVATIQLFPGEDPATGEDARHVNVAICLLATACLCVILVAINEMLQREGIVDYKKPLDFDTDIAHESGKLLTRRTGTNLYNNFSTSTPAALANGGVPKQWNSSTEQIIHPGAAVENNFHRLWIFYMMFTKLQGFIAFYWIFVTMALQFSLFSNAIYPVFWYMVHGSLLGMAMMFVLSPKMVFLLTSVLHTTGLILGVSFYSAGATEPQMGASFTVFYTCIGASLVIPAINILELSPLNFNESFLAVGFMMEMIAISLMQYFAVNDVSLIGWNVESGYPLENQQDIIMAHFIGMIVLSVILQIIVLWHMPNTFKKSLAEINADLVRMTSYFAFSRMRPIISEQPIANREFPFDVASDTPEVEEKHLSTRNGHIATRYNDRSNSISIERQSPFNDFSETRYNHRAVERDLTPTPEREDPYLQERLQRQHEMNYILSRQHHLRQQSRESPEPQPYINRDEKRLEISYQQQRYNHDSDNYSDRPRSSGSQHQRYNQPPPLLSRQQYYQQYEQERQHSPQRKYPPSRESPDSPVPVEPQLPSLMRHPEHSQTIKSEPGFVVRPRLIKQKSEAPAPPPLPPADYLTKSLPRIKPELPKRESIHPVLIPKPIKQQEEIVPGVEYAHNLRPSEFLRQSRQSMFFRDSINIS